MHYTRACQKQDFEAGLCGCCSDCSSCCFAFFCYPCALAQAWSDARGESCSCCHLHACEIFVKANIRQARGMPQSLCQDWCTNLFCPLCSLVQDMREIKFINAESRISDSNSSIVLNYTNSSNINNSNSQPPQHPYGIPQNYINQGYPPNQDYPPQPQPYMMNNVQQQNYPPQNYPSQNYPPQNYPSQNYPPQDYQPPPFVDDSLNDDK